MSQTPTKIKLVDEKGQTYVSTQTYERLLERLNHLEATTNRLWGEFYKSEQRIFTLEEPKRLQDILDKFKDEKKPHTQRWFEYRHVRFDDLLTLMKLGKVSETEISAGKGKRSMYQVKVML